MPGLSIEGPTAGSAASAPLGFKNPLLPLREMKDSAKMATKILSVSFVDRSVFLLIDRLLILLPHTKTEIGTCNFICRKYRQNRQNGFINFYSSIELPKKAPISAS
jgi:hypothetical protein